MATAGKKRGSKASGGLPTGMVAPAMMASDIERVLSSGALEGFTPGVARQICARFGAKTIEAIASWEPEAKSLLGARWEKASDEILEHAEALPML